MEPFEDDKLVSALESLRPDPRPAFAAELDERAAAGFPRRAGDSTWGRFVDRLGAIESRRALIPAGATALAAVAAVSVAIGISENRNDPSPEAHFSNSRGSGHNVHPPPQGRLSYKGIQRSSGTNLKFEAALPAASEPLQGAVNGASSAGAVARAENRVQPFSGEVGPYASRAARREIERSAQLVLGAEPAEVRKAASEVFETVHAYRGVVLSSSIRDGGEGEAGARFSLLIPSAKLGDAMADFSAIGEVRSRREATADITAPTIRSGEQLRDSRATIEGLLAQLADADTDAERAATEAELRAERRHAAYLRSQLAELQRRANLSRVELRIESGAAARSTNETGGWGIDDAVGDAGHILAIAAGVSIVGLAILAPFALIALLAWLANRARVRRSRQRILSSDTPG